MTDPNIAIDRLVAFLAEDRHEPADIGALLIAAGTRLLEEQFGRAVASAALASTLDTLHGLNPVHDRSAMN